MITELTQEQKDKMPEYVKKWIGIGIDTGRLDYDKTVDIIHDVQVHLLNQEKTPVIIFDDPIEAWVACNYAANGYTVNELKGCVDDYFNGKKPSFKIESFTMPYLCGSFLANVMAFYDFYKYELGIKFVDSDGKSVDDKYEMWKRTTELGLIYNIHDVQGAKQNMCIVCQKPTTVRLNDNNVIHCEGGPAIEYAGRGNIKIYALNGVVVPEWLASTHHSKIDVTRINEITNADVKTEFVRKLGVERLLSLGSKIDSYEKYNDEWWTKSKYELWDMAKLFEGVTFAPHLKMQNMTVKGTWHVEAVSPECRTLEAAIKERFGGRDLQIADIK